MWEKNLFMPEYIPYFLDKVKKHKLSTSETILYGFVRFYTKFGKKHFFWTNIQISQILWLSNSSIKRALQGLEEKKLIQKVFINNNKKQRKITCFVMPNFKINQENAIMSNKEKYKQNLNNIREKMQI